MLMGAFAAVVATSRPVTRSIGRARRGRGGGGRGAIFGIVVIDLRGDAIVAGLAINLFALGATTFLMRAVFGVQGGFYDPSHARPGALDLPLLGDIPGIGAIVSGQTALVWVAVAHGRGAPGAPVPPPASGCACGRSARTPSPRAASASASAAPSTRAVLASGALCGLAGAQLSLGIVTQFVEGMTFGRGFIALVAVMFGRAHPIGVLGASLFFGGAYALALRLQGQGVPVPVREHAAVPRHDPGARRGLRSCGRTAPGPPGHRRRTARDGGGRPDRVAWHRLGSLHERRQPHDPPRRARHGRRHRRRHRHPVPRGAHRRRDRCPGHAFTATATPT